jgi:hypothetical protein
MRNQADHHKEGEDTMKKTFLNATMLFILFLGLKGSAFADTVYYACLSKGGDLNW